MLRSPRDGDVGAGRVMERLRALEAEHGERFAPAPLLVETSEGAGRFFEEESGAA